MSTLRAGQSYDELPALQERPSPVSSEAATDCRVMLIDLNTISSCAQTNQEIHQAVLTAAYDHMNGMLAQMQQLKVFTGVQRLADFLLELCNQDYGPAEFSLPYDKFLLAGQLGMKPESLSRAFSKLKNFGVTTQTRDVQIVDVAVLARVVDFDRGELGMAA